MLSLVLDPTSPLPLYSQLAELLSRRIALGEYPPGSRIPSEPQLARAFAIGRPTVRQALEVLVRRGALERRRGTGTFVAERRHQVDLFSLGGTVAAFRSQGVPITSRWIERPHRRTIGVDELSPLAGMSIFRAQRLSSINEIPVLLETIDLRADVFPRFDHLDFGNRSISELVRDEYQQQPIKGQQLFRVAPLDQLCARLLQVPLATAALFVERTLDFPGTEAAVYAQLHCLTDQVVLSQTLGGDNL